MEPSLARSAGFSIARTSGESGNFSGALACIVAGRVPSFSLMSSINPIGVINVDLNIQKKYKVPKTAVAEVYPVSIFGDVAVALRTLKTTPLSYQPGDTIPSQPATGGLDALEARADSITATLGRITNALESEFVRGGGLHDIRETVASVNRLVGQIQAMTVEQNRNLTATLGSFKSSAAAIDSAQLAATLIERAVA